MTQLLITAGSQERVLSIQHLSESLLTGNDYVVKYVENGLVMRVILNVVLASFFLGYSYCYFNTINFEDTCVIFRITYDKALAQGFLSFCIPIGGCIGAYFSSYFMKQYSRRQCILWTNYLACATLVFLQSRYIALLFICRIIQGLCVGFFSSVIPLYIKEFSPTELTGTMGPWHQIAFTLGVTFAFLQTYMLSLVCSPNLYWRVVYTFPIIPLLYQAYNIRNRFPFETPKYLLQTNRELEARELLAKLYKSSFVQQRVQELKESIKMTRRVSEVEMTEIMSNRILSAQNPLQNRATKHLQSTPNGSSRDIGHSNKLASATAIHLSILQQMTGIQAVIIYGGEITLGIFPALEKILPIFLHLEAVFAACLTIKLLQHFGRKIMLTIGVLVCGVLTILMGIAFLILKDGSGVVNPWASGAIIVSMFVFRGVFGLSVGPVTLLYIPEIVEMNIVAISTMLNLFTAALVTLTFPIARKLLGNNPGPIFLFYGLYSLLSSALNAWLVVESKDSPEFTIRHSFEHKLQALRTL